MSDNIEPEANPEPVTGRWATGAAVVAAVFASACCILPLFFGVVGISTVALAGAFESVRPVMLGLTAILLAVGFYYNYFRRPACEPGDACERPRSGLRRFNRSVLWLATVAVVALAFFPSYATILTRVGTPTAINLSEVASTQIVLEISGMTCAACSVSVRKELAAVPGVLGFEVDFDSGKAIVLVEVDEPPSSLELLSAVDRAGYSAVVALPDAGGEG